MAAEAWSTLTEELHQALSQSGLFPSSDLAFPYGEHPPSRLSKSILVPAISRDVPFELRNPVLLPGGGNASATLAPMLVPEATVNEDHLPTAWEDNVRDAGQITSM